MLAEEEIAGISVQCLLKLCYRVVDSILRQFARLWCSFHSVWHDCVFVNLYVSRGVLDLHPYVFCLQ